MQWFVELVHHFSRQMDLALQMRMQIITTVFSLLKKKIKTSKFKNNNTILYFRNYKTQLFFNIIIVSHMCMYFISAGQLMYACIWSFMILAFTAEILTLCSLISISCTTRIDSSMKYLAQQASFFFFNREKLILTFLLFHLLVIALSSLDFRYMVIILPFQLKR